MKSKMKLLRGNMAELLNLSKLEALSHNIKNRKFTKNNLIITDALSNDEVFIVHSGRLRVYLSYEGREFTLRYLEPGDIFTTHTRASIASVTDAELMFIDTHIFHQELAKHPEIALVITEILGEILASSWDAIESILFQDVKSRLVAFLISLAKELGQRVDNCIEFSCHLTIEDIASVIASSRQTTSSLFNELIKDGFIARVDKNKIRIIDMGELEKIE